MLVFIEQGGKLEYPEKNPSVKGIEPMANSSHILKKTHTYGFTSRNQTQATQVGDECCYHCTIPVLFSPQLVTCSSRSRLHFKEGVVKNEEEGGVKILDRSLPFTCV